MSKATLRLSFLLVIIHSLFLISHAQPAGDKAKPYRILTAGRQVTVKSSQPIQSLMVWTSGGHRILEQKNIDAGNYTFRVDVKEKVFFVMIRLKNGKVFSEKIGVQER